MILRQHFLQCLSQASYLLGDERSGSALVVDPRRDVELYLEEAARLGLRIEHVLLTHFHADFASGHLELRARTGAEIHLGAAARADYPFRPLSDDAALECGDLAVVALETPGHTPESISLLVHDRAAGGGDPQAVLTGDTLFVGDVGRPDLMASVGLRAEDLAAQLYDSLHHKLMTLPDATVVYPAHGAGSMCGKDLGCENFTTIGQQRLCNAALQAPSRAEFVALVTADQPLAPAYFAWDADYNRRLHPTLDQVLAGLRPLSLEALLAAQRDGAQILDSRSPSAFARGHLAGSRNAGLAGRYATWAGAVLDPRRPVALVADPGRERESALRLGRVGFDRIVGFLEGGATALGARPDLLRTIRRLDAGQLAVALAGPRAPLLLDVRQPGEHRAAAIAGSAPVPLSQLAQRVGEVPADRPIVVYCAEGYRSMVAASVLAPLRKAEVMDLAGGFEAWRVRASAAALLR